MAYDKKKEKKRKKEKNAFQYELNLPFCISTVE